MFIVEKTLILCRFQGFIREYVPVFLAGKMYRIKKFKRGAKKIVFRRLSAYNIHSGLLLYFVEVMNISNKHYRDMQRAIDHLNQKEKMDNALTKLELARLEKQKDGSERSIADNIGRIIGHFIFNSGK